MWTNNTNHLSIWKIAPTKGNPSSEPSQNFPWRKKKKKKKQKQTTRATECTFFCQLYAVEIGEPTMVVLFHKIKF